MSVGASEKALSFVHYRGSWAAWPPRFLSVLLSIQSPLVHERKERNRIWPRNSEGSISCTQGPSALGGRSLLRSLARLLRLSFFPSFLAWKKERIRRDLVEQKWYFGEFRVSARPPARFMLAEESFSDAGSGARFPSESGKGSNRWCWWVRKKIVSSVSEWM